MPRKRTPTAKDELRALRREAATVASELARRLQHRPESIADFGPVVLDVLRGHGGEVFSEIDDHQQRYEGGDEGWFSRLRQVRNHPVWGPRLFVTLDVQPDEAGPRR